MLYYVSLGGTREEPPSPRAAAHPADGDREAQGGGCRLRPGQGAQGAGRAGGDQVLHHSEGQAGLHAVQGGLLRGAVVGQREEETLRTM